MSAFGEFKRAPSVGALLDAYTALGCQRFVSEISGQDLGVFFEYHVELLKQ